MRLVLVYSIQPTVREMGYMFGPLDARTDIWRKNHTKHRRHYSKNKLIQLIST